MRRLNGRARPIFRSRLALGVGALAVALAAPPFTPPIRAASTGTLRGRVINETTGRPQGGVKLTLISARPDGGDRATVRAVTQPDGRYLFRSLETGPARIYALNARYGGGLFPGSAIRLPANTSSPPVIASKLRVWDTTTDPRAITVARTDLFVVPSEGDVGVIESVKVVNSTRRAYVGRGRDMGVEKARSGPSLSLGFSLPSGADGESVVIGDTDLGGPPPVTTEFGFAASVAVPPGETATTFSYRIEGLIGVYDLTRTALYPTEELSVYAVEPFEVKGNRLAPAGSKTVGGVRYRIWSTEDDVAAGDAIQVVATAEGGTAPGLIMGLSAFLAFVSGAGLLALWRRRGRRRATLRRTAGDAPSGAGTALKESGSAGPAKAGGAAPAEVEARVQAGAPATERSQEARPDRSEIIDAIAKLDIDYANGDIPEERWLHRRAELKDEIASKTSESPS